MALRSLATIVLLYFFYHVWRPAWIEIHRDSIWLGTRSHVTSEFTQESVTTLHDVGGCVGMALWTLSCGLSQVHGHGSWLVCEEVALIKRLWVGNLWAWPWLGTVRCMWMWSLHGYPHGIKWIVVHVHLDYSQKPPLGGRFNAKRGDHDTPIAHHRWLFYFYHVCIPAWIETHRDSIWLRTRSHVTSEFTQEHVITLHDVGGCVGTAFGHFLVGSHRFMVTALGSCVWRSGPN